MSISQDVTIPISEQTEVKSRQADEDVVILVGRAPGNDVVLADSRVSGRHAQLVQTSEGLFVEDLGSTNGTSVGRLDQKVQRAAVTPDDVLFLGSLQVPVRRLLSGADSQALSGASSTAPDTRRDVLDLGTSPVLLGRDPAADVTLSHPLVSWHHARIRREGSQIVVEDLGSTNGTFVDGRRVDGRTILTVGSVLDVAGDTFLLEATGRLQRRRYKGNVAVEACNVAVDVPGKRLIEGVSLTLYPSELTGLMGPSGAGKTTLMTALNGYMLPGQGQVLFNGRDLYAHYAQFRLGIGYVPQDDIMHGDLTVRQALWYTAELRLPKDTRRREIDERISRVLAQLGLEGTEDVRIGSAARKGISGGQRKRVNLAMELLTDPAVLFLDEPTSGLSSEDALRVMEVLRDLADEGRTLLLTIHQPSLDVFRQMDNLVLLAKDSGSPHPARLAFYGPAYPDAVHFMNPDRDLGGEPSPDEVLRGLAEKPMEEWDRRYRSSRYHETHVVRRAGQAPPGAEPTAENEIRRSAGGLQAWTLLRRNLTLKIKDLTNTAILLVQAPVIAALIVMVFGDDVSTPMESADPATWQSSALSTGTTLFLMAVAAIWFGCSNAAREIVAEWAIYHRERMFNLKIPSYVGAKLAVLGGLCLLQCSALLAIVYRGCDLRADWLPLLGVLVACALVGTVLGLVVSAFAPSSEVAISLVPLLLLPMVILGGILQPAHAMGPAGRTLCHLMPSHWAFEGLLIREADQRPHAPVPVVEGLESRDLPEEERPDIAERYFPRSVRSEAGTPTAVLLGMLGLFVTGVIVLLKSRDVHP